jgi:hypothetical protein
MAGFSLGTFFFPQFLAIEKPAKIHFTSCSNFQFSISLVFGEISPV